MGLLNHIFGNKKDIAIELSMDDNKRIALWEHHLSNYPKRKSLAMHFSYKNINNAAWDFENTKKILIEIESLISSEFVSIDEEEKLDREILSDLERLKDTTGILYLIQAIVDEKSKQKHLLLLFQEMYNTLKLELHLLKIIRKNPSNKKELLLRLFEIIVNNEDTIYNAFREEFYFDKSIHPEILRIARAIILQQEIKEKIETDGERFADEVFRKMSGEESKHRYRQLGESIFDKLAEMAGAPLKREDIDVIGGIKRMEGFMKNNGILYQIIKELMPKYSDTNIKAVMIAFRRAYNLGHFDELESDFVT